MSRRRVRAAAALLCGVGAIALAASASSGADQGESPAPATTTTTTATLPAPAVGGPSPAALAAAGSRTDQGRALFEESCSSCHGFDGRGVAGRGPDLIGAGEQSADFYLRTGRMPLANTGDQPLRAEPRFDAAQIDYLTEYVGTFGGPPIPTVDPGRGDVSRGQLLFTSSCSGCHAITGQGGVAVGAFAPTLLDVTPTDVAEAIRVGPWVMPAFSRRQLSYGDVDSIARYVDDVVQTPDDAGGWGIGHIGPVPEGMVAWLLAAVALLLVARIIGERNEEGA